MSSVLPAGKLPASLLNALLEDIQVIDDRLVIPPGLGRDAAGLSFRDGYIAVTTDPITFSTNRIGTYSVAVNINDICCLGCRPIWYSASLLLPTDTTENQLRFIWQDLTQQLKHYRIQQIGGHIEVTDSVRTPILVGQMIGEAIDNRLVDITQAQPGHQILLYQPVAIEGTATIAQEHFDTLKTRLPENTLNRMRHLLDDPGICLWPFVERLLPFEGLTGLHDPTEGGLATALHEVAQACGCGLVVDETRLPVREDTQTLARLLHFDPLGLLASGSLIILCEPEAKAKILSQFPNEPIASIGELTSDTKVLLKTQHGHEPLPYFSSDEIIQAYSNTSSG